MELPQRLSLALAAWALLVSVHAHAVRPSRLSVVRTGPFDHLRVTLGGAPLRLGQHIEDQVRAVTASFEPVC